jgi:hypothetical protein
MIQYSASAQAKQSNALLAIGVGGVIAGIVDLLQACILYGGDIILAITAGLLGLKALQGGLGYYALGVLLHFFISFTFAAFHYASSRRLTFLKDSWLVCGLAYGAGVQVVMMLVVLPLSATHPHGPYELRDIIQGLLVHMVVVGLPISYSVRRFAR